MQKIVQQISKHFGLETKPTIQGKSISFRTRELNGKQFEALTALLIRQPYNFNSLATGLNVKRSGPGLIVIIEAR